MYINLYLTYEEQFPELARTPHVLEDKLVEAEQDTLEDAEREPGEAVAYLHINPKQPYGAQNSPSEAAASRVPSLSQSYHGYIDI